MRRNFSPRLRFGIDSTAMLVYLITVYIWGLHVYPLGRDFVQLKLNGVLMPLGARQLFAWEINTFGASPVGYHLVNLVLLYACMQCIYYVAPRIIKGPHWLGTLSATLFMANPVHTESVLNLSGVADLLPCLAALLALATYCAYRNEEKFSRFVISMLAFMFAVLAYRQNVGLVLVYLLYEWLICKSGQRSLAQLIPHIIISIVAYYLNESWMYWNDLTFQRIFVPLYLIFYPIGLLPENAHRLFEMPWLAWVATAAVLGVLALLYRKVRRRALLFGLLSASVVRLAQTSVPVDPVHLIGGGQLLLSNAFFNMALVTVFLHMMYHPKWAKPVIVMTTWMCIIFFVMEIRTVFVWRHAGYEVRAFQQQAAEQPAPFCLLPNIQFYRGAPMCLSESIAYDTLFSRRIPAQSILPLNTSSSLRGVTCRVENWTATGGDIVLEGKKLQDLLRAPYAIGELGGQEFCDNLILQTTHVSPTELRIHVTPNAGSSLAPALIPLLDQFPSID